MKTKSLKMICTVAAGVFALCVTSHGQGVDSRIGGQTIQAEAITKEDAQKKYPPPHGGNYPVANRDPHEASGLVTSPYPPYQKYDCSKVAHGALVLDIRAKKVFVRP